MISASSPAARTRLRIRPPRASSPKPSSSIARLETSSHRPVDDRQDQAGVARQGEAVQRTRRQGQGRWHVVGYHAHAHDFEKIDGESAWDIFFGNTKPEVIMQLDTSNCARAARTRGGAEEISRAREDHPHQSQWRGPKQFSARTRWTGRASSILRKAQRRHAVVADDRARNQQGRLMPSAALYAVLKQMNKV